jgi:hypothetical protein
MLLTGVVGGTYIGFTMKRIVLTFGKVGCLWCWRTGPSRARMDE